MKPFTSWTDLEVWMHINAPMFTRVTVAWRNTHVDVFRAQFYAYQIEVRQCR